MFLSGNYSLSFDISNNSLNTKIW